MFFIFKRIFVFVDIKISIREFNLFACVLILDIHVFQFVQNFRNRDLEIHFDNNDFLETFSSSFRFIVFDEITSIEKYCCF